MNHIQYYESIITNLENNFELRCSIKDFYKMELTQALHNMEIIKLMLTKKVNDHLATTAKLI